MRLENNEYIVSKAGVPDESITITKAALEKWRDHYLGRMKEHRDDKVLWNRLAGKVVILTDMLRLFEE